MTSLTGGWRFHLGCNLPSYRISLHSISRTPPFSTNGCSPRMLAPMKALRTSRGRALPLGATAQVNGVNFALFCRHGTAVWLVIYPMEGKEPLAEIALHPR